MSSLAEQTLPRGFPAQEQRECCFPASPVGPRIIKNGTNELWGKVFVYGFCFKWHLVSAALGFRGTATWKNEERRDNLQDLSWKLKCVLNGSCWIWTSPKHLFPATPQGCSWYNSLRFSKLKYLRARCDRNPAELALIGGSSFPNLPNGISLGVSAQF